MTDLVTSLREVNGEQAPYANAVVLKLCHEAADRIAELEAALRLLRDNVATNTNESASLASAIANADRVLRKFT